MKYHKKIIIYVVTVLFTISTFNTLQAAAKSYKPFMCGMYPAYYIFKDDCEGSNSWYKVYFPDIYTTKKECMRESDRLFNNEMILQMFPDYKKAGDEMKSWVAGCDNLWYF